MLESEAMRVPSILEFENTLKAIYEDMLLQEEKADYVEADRLRQKAIIGQRKWRENYLNAMNNRHATEQSMLERDYQSNLEQYHQRWNHDMEGYLNRCNKESSEGDKANRR